jgi:hypothetical protein
LKPPLTDPIDVAAEALYAEVKLLQDERAKASKSVCAAYERFDFTTGDRIAKECVRISAKIDGLFQAIEIIHGRAV